MNPSEHLEPALQRRVDDHLEGVELALAAGGASRAELRRVADDLELQIREMLAARAGTQPTESDLRAVLAELDPPEAYRNPDARNPVHGEPVLDEEEPAPRIPWAFMIMMALVFVLLNVYGWIIVPKFQDIFSQLGGELPWGTRMLLRWSFSLRHGLLGWLLQPPLFFAIVGIYWALRRNKVVRFSLIVLLFIGIPIFFVVFAYLPLFSIPKLIK